MPYAEAMERYGCDKPDVRYGLELRTVSDAVAGCGFRVFADAVKGGGVVKCVSVPDGARLKNSAVKPKGDVFEQAVAAGAQGLAYARVVKGDGGALALDASKPIKEGFAAEGAETRLARPFRFLPIPAPCLPCVAGLCALAARGWSAVGLRWR